MLIRKQFAASVAVSILLGSGYNIGYALWHWHRDIAFAYAADRGDLPAVRRYLADGVSPNAHGWQGMNALRRAVRHDDIELARVLLAAGADPNTAMGQAIGRQNSRMVAVLLNAGGRMTESDGASALCSAVTSGDIRYATLLLHHGANVNSRDDFGVTPLLCAASSGSWRVFDFLIERGADVYARSANGSTALMYAALSHSADRVRTCRYLLHQGIDVNADTLGETALMDAVLSDDDATPAVLDMLLRNGADPGIRDSGGMSALDHARKLGYKHSAARLQRAEARR